VSHTPGPWRVDEHGTVRGPDDSFVCDVDANDQFARDGSDARLIVAAPELLELARRYASECGECAGVGITIENAPCEECAYIRELIAKATRP
jgi:hypothetical protein